MNKELLQFEVMLKLQDDLNNKVNPDWKKARNNWLRACWVECAELMDHVGFKWWKKQIPNIAQAQIELCDLLHFTLSYILEFNFSKKELENILMISLEGYNDKLSMQEAVDNLHKAYTNAAGILIILREFFTCCAALNLPFDKLYEIYIAKNVLNIFRQNHGYKEGTYIKQWPSPLDHGTVEDNVYLETIMNESSTKLLLSQEPDKLFDFVYNKLEENYPGS